MFDDELAGISATTIPRQPALLPGLKWRAAFQFTTWLTPLVVIGLFSTLFFVGAMLSSWPLRHWLGTAAYIDATVSDVSDDGRLRQVEVIYRFRTSDGRDFSGRATFDRGFSRFARIKPLQTVPVEFLVKDPWENRLREPFPDGFMALVFPVFFLIALVGPVVASRLLRISGDRKIFRRGQFIQGEVIFVKPGAVFVWWGWSGANTAEVFVRFAGEDRAPVEARALCQNDWLIRHLAPGTPVHISYLPRRPTRAMLLDGYVR